MNSYSNFEFIHIHSIKETPWMISWMKFEQFITQAQAKSISQDDIGMLKSFLLTFV